MQKMKLYLFFLGTLSVAPLLPMNALVVEEAATLTPLVQFMQQVREESKNSCNSPQEIPVPKISPRSPLTADTFKTPDESPRLSRSSSKDFLQSEPSSDEKLKLREQIEKNFEPFKDQILETDRAQEGIAALRKSTSKNTSPVTSRSVSPSRSSSRSEDEIRPTKFSKRSYQTNNAVAHPTTPQDKLSPATTPRPTQTTEASSDTLNNTSSSSLDKAPSLADLSQQFKKAAESHRNSSSGNALKKTSSTESIPQPTTTEPQQLNNELPKNPTSAQTRLSFSSAAKALATITGFIAFLYYLDRLPESMTAKINAFLEMIHTKTETI